MKAQDADVGKAKKESGGKKKTESSKEDPKDKKKKVKKTKKEQDEEQEEETATIAIKAENTGGSQSAMGNAIDSLTNELGAKMPSFNRGNETEVSQRKEVEQLMSVLSQKNVHISNKVLQRAIIMPKDMDPSQTSYPNVRQ